LVFYENNKKYFLAVFAQINSFSINHFYYLSSLREKNLKQWMKKRRRKRKREEKINNSLFEMNLSQREEILQFVSFLKIR